MRAASPRRLDSVQEFLAVPAVATAGAATTVFVGASPHPLLAPTPDLTADVSRNARVSAAALRAGP